MFKKLISFILFFILILSGCTNKSDVRNKTPNTDNVTTAQNNNKSIPFKYIFTGFVAVENISDLPAETKVFNTQQEWTEFKNKYMPYENIPWPQYSGDIDFTKDSIIYYSMFDAKADVYAEAWQVDKITLENQQVKIYRKEIDNNLKITASNKEDLGFRYIIVVTVSKNDLHIVK